MPFYLLSFLAALVSPVIFIVNVETWAVFVGLVGRHPWPLVALTLTAGQVLCFALLYVFGDALVQRWPTLRRRIARIDLERFRRIAVPWLLLAALVGIPPLSASSVAAPMVGVRLPTLVALAFAGRLARFMLLAGAPALFSGWLDVSVLPEWLRALA